MQSDFTFIRHKFPEDIVVIPISDVHLGALEHQHKAWDNFCNEVLKNPNTYITLGGDLINNATRSGVSNIFEETMRPREQKRRMVEHLTPLKGRILCAVPGNHEGRSAKDADGEPTYDIMAKLDLEHLYRENMAVVIIGIGDKSSGHKDNYTRPRAQYSLGITHGAGGGAMTGASVNRNERFNTVFEGLDCLIVGHSHKGAVTKPQRLIIDPRQNEIQRRTCVTVISESWLAYGGYALRGMLPPADCGNPQKLYLSKNYKKIEVRW